ncbi:MAG: hypothetical protein JO188_14195 [Hyphomicrobiales bacterium]|nr:hypothetical protein [Hyphomicrobiales bacterium]
MRKVAIIVLISVGLAACADSIFSPDASRRTEPQFSSLSLVQPGPYANERPVRCMSSRTWLTC